MITLSRPARQLVNEFEAHRALLGPIWKRAEELGVMVSAYHNTMETLNSGFVWHHVSEMKKQGRYSDDYEQRQTTYYDNIIRVPMTDEEKAARQALNEHTEISNALFEEYKIARMVVGLRSGKRMQSRFDGASTLTDEKFAAGTEIFYANTINGKFVAPVTELEGIA